jgi:hypothetical protein
MRQPLRVQARARSLEATLSAFPSLSLCSTVAIRILLNGLLLNVIIDKYTKICRHIQIMVKV